MAVAFDGLGYAQRLEATGVPPQQAAGHAAAARDFIMAEQVTKADIALLATKADLMDLKAATKADLAEAKAEMKSDFTEVRLALATLESRIDRLSLQMTVRLGGMMVRGIAALATIQKLSI